MVIRSPIKDKVKKDKVFSDNSASINDSDAVGYDELVKYLEEERFFPLVYYI